jgi:hypothetical protein
MAILTDTFVQRFEAMRSYVLPPSKIAMHQQPDSNDMATLQYLLTDPAVAYWAMSLPFSSLECYLKEAIAPDWERTNADTRY